MLQWRTGRAAARSMAGMAEVNHAGGGVLRVAPRNRACLSCLIQVRERLKVAWARMARCRGAAGEVV